MQDLTLSQKEVLLAIKDGNKYPLPSKRTYSTEFPRLYKRHVRAFRQLLDMGLIEKGEDTWKFTIKFQGNPNYSYIKRCTKCNAIHNKNINWCNPCTKKEIGHASRSATTLMCA